MSLIGEAENSALLRNAKIPYIVARRQGPVGVKSCS